MVVDDEPDAAKRLSTYLRRRGYDVATVLGGEEACARFDAEPVDLLITDLRMPGMRGEELIQKLWDRVPRLPVIIVTGDLDAAEVDTTSEHEGQVVLFRKPVDLKGLMESVETMIGAAEP